MEEADEGKLGQGLFFLFAIGLGVRVFGTEVGTNSKILEAGSAGTSVFHYQGAERAQNFYRQLADEVLRRA